MGTCYPQRARRDGDGLRRAGDLRGRDVRGIDARQHAEVLVGGGGAQAVEPPRGRGAIRWADPRARPPRRHLQRRRGRRRHRERGGLQLGHRRQQHGLRRRGGAGSPRSASAWRPPAVPRIRSSSRSRSVTATTTASTPIAVRARRAGERSGHCHSARYAADRPCRDRMGISLDRCAPGAAGRCGRRARRRRSPPGPGGHRRDAAARRQGGGRSCGRRRRRARPRAAVDRRAPRCRPRPQAGPPGARRAPVWAAAPPRPPPRTA